MGKPTRRCGVVIFYLECEIKQIHAGSRMFNIPAIELHLKIKLFSKNNLQYSICQFFCFVLAPSVSWFIQSNWIPYINMLNAHWNVRFFHEIFTCSHKTNANGDVLRHCCVSVFPPWNLLKITLLMRYSTTFLTSWNHQLWTPRNCWGHWTRSCLTEKSKSTSTSTFSSEKCVLFWSWVF